MLPASCSGVHAGASKCFSHTCTSPPQLRNSLLSTPTSYTQCKSLSGTSLRHQSRSLSQRRRPAQTTMMAAKGGLPVAEAILCWFSYLCWLSTCLIDSCNQHSRSSTSHDVTPTLVLCVQWWGTSSSHSRQARPTLRRQLVQHLAQR